MLPKRAAVAARRRVAARLFFSPSTCLAMVGFCGSRSLSGVWVSLVQRVAGAVAAAGLQVAVGCAAGADAAVRAAVPSALVFSVAGAGVAGRGAFAARSAALVRAVASASGRRAFVGFVSSACPSCVVPSASASRCFSGAGSGSWSSLTLAVGLGVPVFVFWCSSVPPSLPSWSGGSWVAVPSGSFAGAWRFVPAAQSLGLGL